MRGLHLVAILLVLVREHTTEGQEYCGEFNVTGPLPQDRSVTMVFLPKPSIQENVTYAWHIYFRNEQKWLKPEQCLEQHNMTVEENGSTLRISWIPVLIDVRITVMRDGKSQCYKQTSLSVLDSKGPFFPEKPSKPIIVPPQNVTLTLNDVTIGQTGTVRCESKGMRPAVNITAYLDGRQCVSNRTVIHENRTDTYDVTTTCSFTGNKSLNRKLIKCCIGSEQKICSSKKYLNILFPPDTVSANQSVLVSGQSNVTVRCFVSEANPSCDISWRVPDRIQRLTTKKQLDNTAGDWDGRYAQISELSLARNPEHNGQQIACTVKCGNFNVIKETVTLNIPGPPLITITPGIRITRTEGTVDDILKQAWFVPTTIGIAILLLLLLVIGIIVWRTRKRARKLDEPKGGADGQEDGPPIEENEGRVHEEDEQDVLQVGSNHGDGQMYASVVPRSQRQQQANQNERPNPGSDQSVHQGASNHGDGQMYASVLPRSQRQQQANQNEVQPSGSNQLVYVELDFQPTKPASKPEAGSHVESNATDYVSIDFNKTAQVNSGSDKTPYMNM